MVTEEKKRTVRREEGKTPEVFSEVVTINPELAEVLLARSVKDQRKLKASRLESYRRDMVNGRWRLTGQGLLFNLDGELIDGQHRLVACIMAGVSFQTLVVRNLPPDAMPAVDRGAPRNLTDYLRWQGESEAVAMASVIRLSWIWEHGFLRNFEWSFNNPTVEDSIAWLADNPTVREAVPQAIRLRRAPLYMAASVAGAFWYRAHLAYPSETERFVEQLLHGANLSEGDPILAYRRSLARQKESQHKADQRVTLAYLIKAFNSWYLGSSVQHIVWKASSEQYPELVTPVTD